MQNHFQGRIKAMNFIGQLYWIYIKDPRVSIITTGLGYHCKNGGRCVIPFEMLLSFKENNLLDGKNTCKNQRHFSA